VRALSLEEALQIAARQSETVRIARAAVERARGQVYQARSQFYPQLNASLSYQRLIKSQFQEISRRFSDPSAPPDTTLANSPLTAVFASPNTVVFGLTGSQTLFAGGRVISNARASAAGRRAADIGYVAARAQVTLDVTQAYFDAALADRLVAIAESSLVQTERTYRQTAVTRQVGNASEFEALRARVTRDNQRPVVIQARTQRDVAYLRLRQLLDIRAGEPLRLSSPLQDDAPPAPALAAAGGAAPSLVIPAANAPIDVDDVLAEDTAAIASVSAALAAADTSADDRSSVRQARENVTAARNLERAARGQRLPALSVSTNYQRFAYPSQGVPGLHDFFPNWSVSVGLSVPIFTGFRIRGDELVAQANRVQAEQQLQQAREYAALDAQLALAQLHQAAVAYAASAGTSEQASRAYRIAEVRYREGISTQVELNDSRLLLQQSQANRAQAARDLQVARVRLALLRDLPLQSGTATGQGSSGSGAAQQQQGGSTQSGLPQQSTTPSGQQSAGAGQTQGQFGSTNP
jgi:outer membrane protein TolC